MSAEQNRENRARGHGDPRETTTGSVKGFARASFRTAKAVRRKAGKAKRTMRRAVMIFLVVAVVLIVVFDAMETDSCGGGMLAGDDEQMIYQFMAGKGIDDLHIACMMGVMWGESGLDPTSVETIFTEPHRIGARKRAAQEAGFNCAAVAPAYKAKYPKILNLGIGLAGWTDTTDGARLNRELRDFAKSRGADWYEMALQLEFWWCTFSPEANRNSGATNMMFRKGYGYDDFMASSSIEEGCRLYMKGYEGILNGTLAKRTTKAKEYYRQIRSGALSTGISANGWTHPCPDYVRVSSPFGPRDGTAHRGIDLAAPQKTAIYAAASGTVTISRLSSSAGYYCAIDHGNGYVTKYMHQWKEPSVSVGDEVKAGEKIGEVGSTGRSTGPHLHFQVELNGTAIDPAPILKEAGTRTVTYSFDCGFNGSVKAGEAAGIAKDERMSWLFPHGLPATEEEMKGYLEQIRVPIINERGQATTMTLTCHKKLANEITAAFAQMKKAGFKVKAGETACYCWRGMASGTGARSHHSYGVCIDINWNDNPASYTKGDYSPGKNPYSITKNIVRIWKRHGFYWGGDWSGRYKDYMHMTYTDH